jgi:hypothetical protein
MNRYPLHRCAPRFPRTASEAFRDYRYGAAIERPVPSVWRRLLTAFVRWL